MITVNGTISVLSVVVHPDDDDDRFFVLRAYTDHSDAEESAGWLRADIESVLVVEAEWIDAQDEHPRDPDVDARYDSKRERFGRQWGFHAPRGIDAWEVEVTDVTLESSA